MTYSDFWNYPLWEQENNLRDPGREPFWMREVRILPEPIFEMTTLEVYGPDIHFAKTQEEYYCKLIRYHVGVPMFNVRCWQDRYGRRDGWIFRWETPFHRREHETMHLTQWMLNDLQHRYEADQHRSKVLTLIDYNVVRCGEEIDRDDPDDQYLSALSCQW